MSDLTCNTQVTRDTGYSTPLSPRVVREQCGKPATKALRDETGKLLAWSCTRHDAIVQELSVELGLPVVSP